jgi:hypothetical protein
MIASENTKDTDKQKRVQIKMEHGRTIYSAAAWPGWMDIRFTLVGFGVVALILAFFLFFGYQIGQFFRDFTPYDWLNRILLFVFSGGINPTFTFILGFILLWMPFFLIYQVSPKQFWIENNTLVHKIQLLGLIQRTHRIPFDRIYEIKISESTYTSGSVSRSIYGLVVVYEMTLPKWVYYILAYWNEKFTRWPLGLVNGIPTKEEAEQLQNSLLEPITRTKMTPNK